jgi:DNA-binding response OmpR family regulator/class 3 adenylate cyclase/predicted ATPase
MRSRMLLVAHDPELRGRLARLFNTSGHAVELAESVPQARRVDFRRLARAVVVSEGLGADVQALTRELRAATKLLLVTDVAPDAGLPIRSASDEASLLAWARDEPQPQSKDTNAVLQFSDYRLDLVGHTLTDGMGREISLTHGEFRLLRAFAQRPGRVLSREDLLTATTGRDADAFDRSIDVLIMRLRRKIELDRGRPSVIVTVPGRGYKLTTQVKNVAAADGSSPTANEALVEGAPLLAERRQITALSVELMSVGGAGLAADPEELRAVIDIYRRRVNDTVTRLGGSAAQYVGREVFAYFGYPVTREDAAERAIDAGLALVQPQGRGKTKIPPDFSVRVGIATGLVVADPAGEVIGGVSTDAAQMRNLAESGQVIIAASTRQLGGELFTYHAFQPMSAKGVLRLETAWQVLGPTAAASRSEAIHNGNLTPLIGREEDLELLIRRWRQAVAGEGRVVLLSGEPGIGKSRLLAEFARRLAVERHASLNYFCSPLHQGSALHPIVARWEWEAGFERGDSAQRRLHKLENIIFSEDLSPTDVALLANMLGLAPDEHYLPPDLSPQQRKVQTFALLLRRLACLAQSQPVLMLFEDAHWADPSSLELLDTLVSQIADLPILLVMSCRPEFVSPWIGRADVSLITLTRLDRRQSLALARQLITEHVLSPAFLERIIAQTDGVPLFIEELTKAVLETNFFPVGLGVPRTLQTSLMARLDRLSAGKPVAQISAVIGREFTYDLLIAVAGLTEKQLAMGLEELVGAGLVFRRGFSPDAVYTFKHALVQETAYQSLLKARRQSVHRCVAETVRDQHPDRANTEPEIVAHHFTQAGLRALAVEWWGKAGELAMRGCAYAEAIGHLEMALKLSRELGDGPDQQRSLFRLQLTYGNALRMARGLGAPETQAAYAIARDLAAAVEDVSERFPAYYGMWVGSYVRGELAPMQKMATAILRDAESRPASPEAAMAQRIYGMTCWYAGNFIAAQKHLEQALAINAAKHQREDVFRFNLDVTPLVMVQLPLALWPLGILSRAVSLTEEGVAHALETKHIHTIAMVHDYAASFEMMRRHRGAPHVGVVLRLAQEHGLSDYIATGMLHEGWVRSGSVDREAGIAEMHHGLALIRSLPEALFMPLFMTVLAEAEAETGHPDQALAILDKELADIERTEQRWYSAEVHRARGEILLKCWPREETAAESAFLRSIEIARSQEAKLFELQAAVSLAGLWIVQGKGANARKLLAPIYAWFDPDLDCDALRKARTLLD